MKIALAQLNPVVGDVAGNLARLEQVWCKVREEKPDLLVLPELFLTGYPPLDLLERSWFIDRVEQALRQVEGLSAQCPDTAILVGAPVRTGKTVGKPLYNAAVLFGAGRMLLCQPKSLLPTYDVFDESRYFQPADRMQTVELAGEVLGISICEDAWTGDPELQSYGTTYNRNPIADLAAADATLLVNISASPFTVGKEEQRYKLLSKHARRYGLPLVFVNQVGANDELVFDGRSMAFDAAGEPIQVLRPFAEQVSIVDTSRAGRRELFQPLEKVESVYRALVLGIQDYAGKCGFREAVLGLSGGVDSAVACCLAVAALGPENVWGVAMPSEYSSAGSVADARLLAQNLGVKFTVMPITDIYHQYLATLAGQFAGKAMNEAEENLQARVRGNLLMALSNKFGHLVITTGNKSELAVGYCTLYGDMSGGLAVLADVPKTMVYELARYINREREVIPESTIRKPPSAELRPNQTDQDTLPPYEVLDEILKRYLEKGQSAEEIASAGFEKETVDWVLAAVRKSEYKRRQAAVGLKVTSKAFGIGRRVPIAARYRTGQLRKCSFFVGGSLGGLLGR